MSTNRSRSVSATIRRTRTLAAVPLLVLGGVLAPGGMAAQPMPNSYAFGGDSQIRCGSTVIQLGPNTSTASCTSGPASYLAMGSTAAGIVRSMASVTVNNAAQISMAIPSQSYSAAGSGYWGDRLSFSGPVTPASLQLFMHFTGSASASVSGPVSQTTAHFTAAWGFAAASLTPLASYFNSSAQTAGLAGVGSGYSPTVAATIDDAQVFTLAVTPGVPIDLWYTVSSDASFLVGGGNIGDAFSGGAIADMSHTGLITGLAFFDASGADITSQVSYSFANGTQIYPNAPTTTPEPATLGLLATGLVGLAGARRMRVRRVAA